MSKVVKVTYNAETLLTEITVDGQSFDTSRINGKEIADWAYPFMLRKVRWNGFYDEMIEALGGENEFDLVFEGSEEDLNELKEAWEDAPVTIISGENVGNTVVIEYDENSLTTDITVNGQPFDTSRINGKEIEDWVYPFMMRKVKWDGIFEELAKAVGSEEYAIQFSGSNSAIKELMEECPESVEIKKIGKSEKNAADKSSANDNDDIDESLKQELEVIESVIYDANSSVKDKEKAFKWLVSRENVNHPQIHFLIGNCCFCGIGVEQNCEKAVEWYTKAAEQGDTSSQRRLGLCYSSGNGVERNYEKAVKWYIKAAEQGDSDAQDSLGDCYYYGKGIEQNYEKAVEWYSKAAEQGDMNAQCKLGYCYNSGEGVEQDKQKAFNLFSEAAEAGDSEAQFMIGACYKYGDGIEQDIGKAVQFLKLAAEQEEYHAQSMLADCYYYGEGVEQNYRKAFELYNQAVEMDYPVYVQLRLANCYSNGIGTNQDYQKAFELYSQVYDEEGTERFIENLNSAEEDIYSSESSNMKKEYAFNFLMSHSLFDDPTIHFLLGKCFDEGIGTVQNYKEAVNWYTKAAEQDNAKACNNLGNCYLHGNGVKKDRAKAMELFEKAKDLGSEAGKNNYNLQKTKDVAGKLGKGVLGVLGTVGSAYAQSYAQSVLDDDDEY